MDTSSIISDWRDEWVSETSQLLQSLKQKNRQYESEIEEKEKMLHEKENVLWSLNKQFFRLNREFQWIKKVIRKK